MSGIVRLRFFVSLVFLSAFLFTTHHADSQCLFGGINAGDVTPGAIGETFALTTVWGGEQYTLDAVSGCEYTVTTCGGSFDTQITIFDESGVWVFYNDDFCGVQSEITFTAASTGVYTIQINEWNCTSNFTSTYFAVTLNSCLGGCNDPSACNYSPIATDASSCCYGSCLDFELFDSVNDGWNGAIYTISDAAGSVACTSMLFALSGSTKILISNANPLLEYAS